MCPKSMSCTIHTSSMTSCQKVPHWCHDMSKLRFNAILTHPRCLSLRTLQPTACSPSYLSFTTPRQQSHHTTLLAIQVRRKRLRLDIASSLSKENEEFSTPSDTETSRATRSTLELIDQLRPIDSAPGLTAVQPPSWFSRTYGPGPRTRRLLAAVVALVLTRNRPVDLVVSLGAAVASCWQFCREAEWTTYAC